MRYDKLLEIALAYEREGRERRALSYQRTQIRRDIEAVLVAARRDGFLGNWQHFQARLDRLREGVPSSLEQYRALFEDEAWQDRQAYLRCPTPSHPSNSGRKMAERRSAARTPRRPDRGPADDIGNVSLELVRSACPTLQKHIPEVFETWTALRSSGRRLCVAATINTQVWSEAESYLGPDAAIAALAVTMQRADDGQVASPGAYLRTLIQRGRNGQLRISRSLFALAAAKDAGVPKRPSHAMAPYRGFPSGRINWSGWADPVREHAPKPTPDVETVADAFRSWCGKGNIDLAQPSIEKAFIGFCKKWRQRL